MVVLWHMKVTITEIFDIVQTTPGPMQVHTEVNPLSAEFDIDDQLMKDPDSIQVNYVYNSKVVSGPPGQPVMTGIATPNDSTSHTYWRTNPSRNIRPCDPSLNVSDPGCQDIDNTFHVSVDVEIPITTTYTVINEPPDVKPLTTSLGADFFFAYDYTQKTQSDSLTPADLPWGVFHTMIIIPQGYGTPSVSKYTVDYELTAKDMVINYFPLTQDMRAAANSLTDYSAVTTNLAKSGSNWILHANNKLQPTVDGEDVSSSFKAWRWVRSWLAGAGADGNRSMPYSGAPSPGSAMPQWLNDNGPDDTGQIQSGWLDVPGGPQLPTDPNQWPTVRQLDEFVATVYNYPEFGLIYYMVVWDVKPNAYRIRMYPSQSITADEWCAIKARDSPFLDEGSWQPPVADLNSSSSMVDTGWTDSTGAPT